MDINFYHLNSQKRMIKIDFVEPSGVHVRASGK